jgi:hypothetical protein
MSGQHRRSHRAIAAKILAVAMALGSLGPAAAHHSGAMFDHERTIRIKGVVREFLWNNPHASIKVEVVAGPGAAPVIWAIEMNGPNNLVREGWKRTTLHAGDAVTFWINPLRSGLPGGWYVGVQLADGKTLGVTAKD